VNSVLHAIASNLGASSEKYSCPGSVVAINVVVSRLSEPT
jgi:hypothetical protein